MSNRQIVIISGKTCTGKTGLARLLHSQYQFQIIATRDILLERLGMIGKAANRDQLIAEGIKLDQNTHSRWVAKTVAERIQNLPQDQGVVVDHVSSPAQIEEFRRLFGPNLVHVHLYASTDTLLKRYAESEGKVEGSPPYEKIDHLTDQQHILKLKADADVRINTDRTDDKDTLVRVAARLHLFSSPEVRCVDVLVGGQYGSEGKGNIVAYLAREYDVLIRVGGPNAGHTVATAQGKFIHHLLPSGSGFTAGKLLLGPGMTINIEGLLAEIQKLGIGPDRLFIDPQASIIEKEDIELEHQGVVGAIASTGSGSGAAKARRILHRGSHQQKVRLAQEVPELKDFIGATADQLELAYRAGKSILLEGTQGSLLSLYHGRYPYVTSRDTNVAGCLAEAGISPSRVRKILMVVRTTPIRVANPDGDDGNISGFLKHETSFEVIAKRAGLDPTEIEKAEITSTTKRKRRVGWFEWEQFRRACDLNAPTDIVLTFVDYFSKKTKKLVDLSSWMTTRSSLSKSLNGSHKRPCRWSILAFLKMTTTSETCDRSSIAETGTVAPISGSSMKVEYLIESYPRLYHMAEKGTWKSIRERGLLSTSAVLDHFRIKGNARAAYETKQRAGMVTVLPGRKDAIVLRDQKPMPPDRLKAALIDGTTPEEWYRIINGKVFFWAEQARLFKLLNARGYRHLEHDVLTINTESLVKTHASCIWLSHMNSGNTWPMPHARGKDLFQSIANYGEKRNGKPYKKVVEFLVDHSVPDIAKHVLAVDRMKGDQVLYRLWTRPTRNK